MVRTTREGSAVTVPKADSGAECQVTLVHAVGLLVLLGVT